MPINVRKIALLTGHSISTVSRVLSGNYGNVHVSEKTRDKILKTCQELDYVPNVNASRLFSKKTRIIGLLCPISSTGFGDPNLSRFITTVYDSITVHDYRLQFISMDGASAERGGGLALFKRKELDGLIIWGLYGETDWLSELRRKSCPYILASNRCGAHPAVTCDDDAGVRQIIEHCTKRGAKSFIYVDGPEVDVSIRRREAFLRYAQERSIAVLQSTTFNYDGGYALVKPILAAKPDAVICVNDTVAIGLMLGLQKSGICIPRDLMVTGADDIDPSGYAFPPLTTYDQQAKACGIRCAEKMLARLENGTELTSETIAPELKFRASTCGFNE